MAENTNDAVKLAYWLSSYPLGMCWANRISSASLLFADVIKSRVQLREAPPVGTPVRYIAHEFNAILAESGLYVSCLPRVSVYSWLYCRIAPVYSRASLLRVSRRAGYLFLIMTLTHVVRSCSTA